MPQTPQEKAAAELLALAQELGITLPMPIEQILEWENQGATVDLLTGAVTINGANQQVTLTETLRHLLEKEVA